MIWLKKLSGFIQLSIQVPWFLLYWTLLEPGALAFASLNSSWAFKKLKKKTSTLMRIISDLMIMRTQKCLFFCTIWADSTVNSTLALNRLESFATFLFPWQWNLRSSSVINSMHQEPLVSPFYRLLIFHCLWYLNSFTLFLLKEQP